MILKHAVVAVLAGLIGVGTASAQSTPFVVEDHFTASAERASAQPLDGMTTEKGNRTWKSTPSLRLAGEGEEGYLGMKGSGSVSGRFEIPAGDVIEIELDAQPASAQKGWIAVGFSDAESPADITWKNGAFLYLDTAGSGMALADGTKQKLGSKKLGEDFKGDAMNRLKLRYDVKANSISGWINDKPIVENVSLSRVNFTPGAKYAGFSAYGISADSKMDNFRLTVEGADASALTVPAGAAAVTAAAKPAAAKPADVYRILYIGDSITQHLPNEKVGWTYTAGMAASSVEKDYAHLLASSITQALKAPKTKVEPMFLAHGGGKVRNYLGRTDEYSSFEPDLAIVQFGENEKPGDGFETFAEDYATLLKELNGLSPKPRIICTGVWAPTAGNPYSGPAATIEAAVQRAAQEHGAGFAPIQQAAVDPANRGFGATKGVQWHPNDQGMKAYADSIFAVWQNLNVP
ncbi:MAG TPA: SGNH/GDSL hydrolase family protein [Tepidisphaeraceae bacterium]|jgi:hypothetical protein|nr:SGNH/GDSL hydrolase family protein [Tepidisphaeraceae bacterium]